MARRNPFRTEAEAFRLLLFCLVAFAAIALASILGGWEAGVPVWALVTAAALWYYLRPLPEPVARQAPPHVGAPDERRILVVANETLRGRVLEEEVCRKCAGAKTQVLVVAPALTDPVRHWVSDIDPAREAASKRLGETLARLRELGIEARGEIGDPDPLQAIEDALRTFGADEIIISTHPEGRSNWLERGVVEAAKQRFALPIHHVVVDLGAEAKAAGATSM